MKIVTAFLRYDYGIRSRGESVEKEVFFAELKKISPQTIPFWLEDNGFPDNLDLLQQNLISFCETERPDFVFFILMKDEITTATLDSLNAFTKTMNWFCDDQWRFDSFSSKIAPQLSVIVTVDKYSVSKYLGLGCKKVIHSQWAAKSIQPEQAADFRFDVSFVGGKNPTREWIIQELAAKDIHVDCFGAGWDNGRVTYDEMNEIFRTSKITLNLSNSTPRDIAFFDNRIKNQQQELRKIKARLSRPYILKGYRSALRKYFRLKRAQSSSIHIADKKCEQIKARNFEIPAANGFQISQFALEIEDYFHIGKEVVVYSTIDELILQIAYYLKNENERELIRAAGHEAAKRNVYSERFKQLLMEL